MGAVEKMPLALAVDAIRRHRKVQTRTILKAIVGMSAAGHLNAFADSFHEWAVPSDSDLTLHVGSEPERDCQIPMDFWTDRIAPEYSLNWGSFGGTISVERQCLFNELPYRLRRHRWNDCLMTLNQAAHHVSVDREGVRCLIEERDWRPWKEFFYRSNRPGPEPKWLREAVLARLAFKASQHPNILRDAPALVDALHHIFQELHHGDEPADRTINSLADFVLKQDPDLEYEIAPPD